MYTVTASEAQKRASAKYQREKMQLRTVKFGPNDADILAHLDARPNKAGYIKALIRADMGRAGGDEG